MPISPACLVQDGSGPFLPTTDGLNVTPLNTVSVVLADPTGVDDWYLEVTGTDETSTPPTMTGVNEITHQVISPAGIVTMTMPAGAGRAFLFKSTVVNGSGSQEATFALYQVTSAGARVAAAGETTEGNATYGWSAILNPLIRTGAAFIRYDDYQTTPVINAQSVQQALDYFKNQNVLPTLVPSPAGTYGSTTTVPVLTVDQYGRVTSGSSTPAQSSPLYDLQGCLLGKPANYSTVYAYVAQRPTTLSNNAAHYSFRTLVAGTTSTSFFTLYQYTGGSYHEVAVITFPVGSLTGTVTTPDPAYTSVAAGDYFTIQAEGVDASLTDIFFTIRAAA